MVECMIDSAYKSHMNSEKEEEQENDLSFHECGKDELSFHHQVHDILQDVDWKDLPELISRMDEGSIGEDARQMAQFHKTTILSIRQKLIDQHLIMRASYNSLAFDEYPAADFKRKSFEYIKRSGLYQLIGKINEMNPKLSQTYLANIVEQVEQTLKDLLHSKLISIGQYLHMRLDRSYVQLNYLHFVPDTDQEGTPVRPIIICKDGPTTGIACYLSRLLWSMLNRKFGCKSFSNGADAVRAFEQYAKNGHLKSTSLFASWNMNEFCTQFPHEETVKALEDFLYRDGIQQVQDDNGESLTSATIINLVRLALANQFFVYENKLYQQMKGGVSGSLLTIPLALINMLHCRPELATSLMKNKEQELFGRCRDNLLLTWNGSKDQLSALLNVPNNGQRQESIQVISSIGKKVHFLDVELSPNNGILHTQVHLASDTNRYQLPKKFDFGNKSASKLLQAALNYAVRCCSTEADYHREGRRIRDCYLLRGFSSEFIRQSMIEFYVQFDVGRMVNGIFTVPYDDLRKHVLQHYQQQSIMKEQHRQQHILRFPYPSHWDAQLITGIKNSIRALLKDCFGMTEAQLDAYQFELVPRPNTPLCINDYLVDRKPPCRLLTLSDSEKKKSFM